MTTNAAAAGPIACVVGARPNFIKMAPLMRAFAARHDLPRAFLVHTGQHHDEAMSDRFLRELGMPQPAFHLGAGSGSASVQVAEIMRRIAPVFDTTCPSVVVVVGDVTSTFAAACAAAHAGIRLVHVEAGLRSFDPTMPEERNRRAVDRLSDLLLTSEPSGRTNLVAEGIPAERVRFVGNVMIDTLLAWVERAPPLDEVIAGGSPLALRIRAEGRFGLVTLHRPANVDEPAVLGRLLQALDAVGSRLPLVWPMHPRTQASLARAGLAGRIDSERLLALPPLGYPAMLRLMRESRVVLTDSGGVQEETTALGVPCLTLRENTERPVTLTEGTNRLVARDRASLLQAVEIALAHPVLPKRRPPLWDGRAGERAAAELARWLHAPRALLHAAGESA